MALKKLGIVAVAVLLGACAGKAKAPVVTAAATAALETPALTAENTWNLDLSTGGRVTIQLRPDVAPNHVARIKQLTQQGFYNGTVFHRVIDGFMAQGGDPTGSGQGGSQLPDLTAEFNVLPHVRGAVAMARTNEPNTANSQFFVMLAPRLSLDNKYTNFGRVVSGIEYVDRIERGEPPINPTRIVRASMGSDNAPPLPPQMLIQPAPNPIPGQAPGMEPQQAPQQQNPNQPR